MITNLRLVVVLSVLSVYTLAGAAPNAAEKALARAKTTTSQLKALSVHPLSRLAFWRDRSLLTREVKGQLATIKAYLKAESKLAGEEQILLTSNDEVVLTKEGRVGEITWKRLIAPWHGAADSRKTVGMPRVSGAGKRDPAVVLEQIKTLAADIAEGKRPATTARNIDY